MSSSTRRGRGPKVKYIPIIQLNLEGGDIIDPDEPGWGGDWKRFRVEKSSFPRILQMEPFSRGFGIWTSWSIPGTRGGWRQQATEWRVRSRWEGEIQFHYFEGEVKHLQQNVREDMYSTTRRMVRDDRSSTTRMSKESSNFRKIGGKEWLYRIIRLHN